MALSGYYMALPVFLMNAHLCTGRLHYISEDHLRSVIELMSLCWIRCVVFIKAHGRRESKRLLRKEHKNLVSWGPLSLFWYSRYLQNFVCAPVSYLWARQSNSPITPQYSANSSTPASYNLCHARDKNRCTRSNTNLMIESTYSIFFRLKQA